MFNNGLRRKSSGIHLCKNTIKYFLEINKQTKSVFVLKIIENLPVYNDANIDLADGCLIWSGSDLDLI